jgi:hypothetical protein
MIIIVESGVVSCPLSASLLFVYYAPHFMQFLYAWQFSGMLHTHTHSCYNHHMITFYVYF